MRSSAVCSAVLSREMIDVNAIPPFEQAPVTYSQANSVAKVDEQEENGWYMEHDDPSSIPISSESSLAGALGGNEVSVGTQHADRITPTLAANDAQVSDISYDILPQDPYEARGQKYNGQQSTIKFHMNGLDYVHLEKAFNKELGGLERADEGAFAEATSMATKQHFRLLVSVMALGRRHEYRRVVQLQGYAKCGRQFASRQSSGCAESITIAKLARQVAIEVKTHLDHLNNIGQPIKVPFDRLVSTSLQRAPHYSCKDHTMAESASKRRRIQRSPSPVYKLDEQDESYEPYVPVAQRRQAKLAKLTSWGATSEKDKAKLQQEELDEREDEEREEERRREKARKERTLLMEAQEVHDKKAAEDAKKTDAEKAEEADAEIMAAIASRRKLASDLELAKGVLYTESIKSSWRPPRFVRERSEEEHRRIREKYHIMVEGENIPPPIENFTDMKVPEPLVKFLKSKRITIPTPIQLQGIPTAFAGRDMIGIAFTGSGKTLAFCLPLIMFALEEEAKLPLIRGEGPVGIILCPSRELATQTYENMLTWTAALAKDTKYPQLSVLLCIGGISMGEQAHVFNKGLHVVVATPGRLIDMLEKKRFTFDNCKYLCMDEADRMIDLGFEDDVRNIMSFFKRQRQTLLFSATMPRKIQDFAQQSLVNPILVNVGRAGAANLDVLQVVEYVKQEAKMVYLLECLQKTPPPVIIFSENKNEVDDIQEYLLLKGVEAVSIHGSKSTHVPFLPPISALHSPHSCAPAQEERQYAIKSFKSGAKDVMVASGVASKGLDFNDIQHVIIFSMPKEIEDYVHQIGRTGRSGKTGIATTFVNMNTPEQTLLDLKYLLMEAGQKCVFPGPAVFAEHRGSRAAQGGSLKGCPVCGGLGHGISNCPKLEDTQRRQMASHRGEDDRGY
ncbi:DEAD-box ATP-dependent RNA helicase 35 [Grifola frondosa]|uniref:RNA helicase n=1 Tax=Grifola frondosa TaxID=5627 RepID=A0A1C7MFZ3_GRIFR|nr:DEAD-box ATP-dependent RNA helicase 35 [Grifola frondosa]